MRVTGERRTVAAAGSTEDRVQDLFHVFPYHYVTKFASPVTRVLDLGSGEGYGAEILGPSVGDYVGLDVSEEAVRHAATRYPLPNVRFEKSDGTTIPFPAASFDLVVSFHVLEHLTDPDTYLTEMARVCTDRGHIVIVTPNRAFRLAPGERPWNRFHVREYGHVELGELLSKHFSRWSVLGITGDESMIAVERARVARARKLARLDPLGLRYRLPEPLLVRVRRLLARVLRRPTGDATLFALSLDDVRCVDTDLDETVHLLGVIDCGAGDGARG